MDPQCVKELSEITLVIMDLERALHLWIFLLEKREDLMPTLYAWEGLSRHKIP